jgi:hypothetical protein
MRVMVRLASLGSGFQEKSPIHHDLLARTKS